MCKCRFTGKDRVEFMEKMCPTDVTNLPPSMGALSILTNDQGGIIDDCIVTNRGDDLYTVINAGHEDKDLPHLEKYMKEFTAGGKEVAMEPLTNNGLLALQGPKAVDVMCVGLASPAARQSGGPSSRDTRGVCGRGGPQG